MKRNISILILASMLFIIMPFSNLFAASDKNSKPEREMVFESPRKLIADSYTSPIFYNNWGIDFALSGSGFAFGTLFNFGISEDLQLTTGFLCSGARNTDEFESLVDSLNDYRVLNKINRLYKFPITLGLKYYVLNDVIGESIKPFVYGAFTPTIIVSTPYDREFFNAIHYGITYLRAGGCLGIGSDFGLGKSLISLNLKYYVVPFGGNGLQSIKGSPIKDFGGFFISVAIGTKF